jgi:hypothetical protein
MRATLSILGLYNYDSTIFDDFTLPVGIVKDDVINNLVMELSEFEVLYPTPDLMKNAIKFWSAKESPKWGKLYATLNLEYNPLNNAYRDETTTDTRTPNLTSTNSGTDTDTEYTSGFNETTPTLAGKTDSTRGTANTVTGTEENKIVTHLEGSIGVITPQNMIQQERIISEFNMTDYIINDFKERFCIQVY